MNAGGDLWPFETRHHVIRLQRAQGLMPVAGLRCGAIAIPRAPMGGDWQRLGSIVDPRIGRIRTAVAP